MRLTFLGTGTSFGVPQIGCSCAVCTSSDPRDRRTRTAALIETPGGARLLLDTPPELRLQLCDAGIASIDAVLFTHDHADHTHGIDDLRAVTVRGGALPMYGSAETLERLERKFGYIFDDRMRPLPGTSKPEGLAHALEPGRTVRIADVDVTAVEVPHGPVRVLAYRIGPLAYVTDAKEVPPAAMEQLRGIRILVLNALFRRTHPTHLSISEAVQTALAIGAEHTYLTHLTHEVGHAQLASELPEHVSPAYDGLTITIGAP